MKQTTFVILVSILFLSFQTVSAIEIESYKISATPVDGNYVENIIEVTLLNNKETSVTQGSLNLAKDAELTAISDSYGYLSYITEQEEENQKITFMFDIPVQQNEKRVLTLQTKTYNLVQKEGYFEYLLIFVPSKDIASFTNVLRLDKNAELYSTKEGNYILVPEANITETETNIIIEWNQMLQKEVPAIFLVRFSQETGINYWKWFGIIVITAAIGAGLGILGNKLYGKHKQAKALKATNILNEREKAVLSLIIKNSNIKQSELVKQLGYTKSNMSKIIKRLEFRGLIEVKKEGKIRILNVGETIKKQL